jgi:hypothetical protein
MGRADFFAAGSYNAVCDQCGGVFKAYDILLQWDNARVCQSCYDPRHPQDFVRPIPDPKPPSWTRADTGMPTAATPGPSQVVDGAPIDSTKMG